MDSKLACDRVNKLLLEVALDLWLNLVGAFSVRIWLPPAVMGWAASCDDGP